MQQQKAAYLPVFHFVDEHLYTTFIEKLARPTLLESLRANQLIRNRYFPGFRITETTPTLQQLLNAYRKEILQRSNSNLAKTLCEQWIRCNSELASIALQSVGFLSEDAARAGTWIEKIKSKLEGADGPGYLRTIVRAISEKFPAEEVLIFVSIIGHGRDQQILRDLVETEMKLPDQPEAEPDLEKKRLEKQLLLAETKSQDLEQSRSNSSET